MKLLLEHGANPNIATAINVTPLQVAAGLLQMCKRHRDPRQIALAIGGQPHRARAAHKKLHAELRLQSANLMADRRRTERKVARGAGDEWRSGEIVYLDLAAGQRKPALLHSDPSRWLLAYPVAAAFASATSGDEPGAVVVDASAGVTRLAAARPPAASAPAATRATRRRASTRRR